MSRYATWNDLVKRYPKGAAASTNQDMDEAYIVPAEDEVDARVSAVATVPFTAPIPGLIKSLTIDVAYYKLTIRSPESKSLGEYLYGKDGKGGIFGQIADGTVEVQADITSNGAWIDKEYHSRFGPDCPDNWQPDSDAIVDAINERSDD